MAPSETVVLIPGIGWSWPQLTVMASRLRHAGFTVHVFWNEPHRRSLAEAAAALARWMKDRAIEAPHIVAHSLGGIVAVKMLNDYPEQRCGRMVLLGSPVSGCLAARRILRVPGGRRFLGGTVVSISSGADLRFPPGLEAGALAGRLNVITGLFLCPRQSNDSTICVEETLHTDLADHDTVLVAHAAMLLSKQVAAQVVQFIRTGRFLNRSAR